MSATSCGSAESPPSLLTELRKWASSRLAWAVSSEGGDTADPQEVADKIFECATTETPVHNPVGSDAQLLVSMMGGPGRQAFIDKVEPLLLPPA